MPCGQPAPPPSESSPSGGVYGGIVGMLLNVAVAEALDVAVAVGVGRLEGDGELQTNGKSACIREMEQVR